MSAWLFPPASPPALTIEGDGRRFPVRRILCVGRNYAAHAREMGADPTREAPFFFAKPGDAVVGAGDVAYPSATADLHHEVELVCALGPSPDGGVAIVGCAVGVDLTRRDLQAEAKAKGRPWDAAKGFDQSAPCGALRLGPPPGPDALIVLEVDGEVRQSARLGDMIWSPDEVLVEADKLWTLQPGDLIFTGTPEGVGPVARGQTIQARIDGLTPLTVTLR